MSEKEMNRNTVEELLNKVSMLSQEIESAGMILEQVTKLSSADDLDRAINEMLAVVGNYLNAERMYIFEKRGKYCPNTYEWCADGLQPEIDTLQDVTVESLVTWINVLKTGKCVYIPNTEDIRETMPEIYLLLKRQKISRVIEAPIMVGSRLIGFLGVDNPPCEITSLIMDSLTTLGACIGALMQIKREQKKIKEKNRELVQEQKRYREALSNRCEYSYTFDLTEGLIHKDFTSAHGINVIKEFGISLPVSFDELNERYRQAYRIELLDTECRINFTREGLLEQYAQGNTNIETEYYSPVNDMYIRVSALMSTDELTGHVYAVIIAVDITESRRREIKQHNELVEAKESLNDVNDELSAALDSEQEKMAVISAMSNIYYASYLIDLRSGVLSVVSTTDYLEDCFIDGCMARDAFRNWIDTVVDEAFAKMAEEFVNLETLPERMKGKQIISGEYISRIVGWIRTSFIVVERDADGTVWQVLWVGQQIDAEKRKELAQGEALKAAYEAANQANAAKSNFLASMSHDIRTPLNAIIGMTAIAGTHLDDKERVADCLSKITVSSKHLLGLINEVLDMSKIESGKLELHDEEFSLPELVDDLLNMIKPQVKAKNHELSVTVSGIEHERVIGDGQRLQQVFMNLMSNAVKYTPEGGMISLTISEKEVNKPKLGCYEFIFEDNGIGMNKEFMEHIFEPFARAADSRVEKVHGTGLGMAITKSMIQMMNGNIKVESELDKGTRITVTIAMKLADSDDAIPYEKFVDLPVLVVDDDEIACQFTCLVLTELGMKGEWVLSGQEAVDRVVEHHEGMQDFFAIILDWKMPGMDGIATTKEIRRRVGNDVPIIIISAYDWTDIELEARAAGANAFISKPLFKSRMAHLFSGLMENGQEMAKTPIDSVIQNHFEGKRALLVEDNELNAEIAGEILQMAGLTVDFAVNGKEALDIMSKVQDDHYDIIFMDIQMPVMNGYDATIAIRSLPGDYVKRVPIIAMTANAFTEDIQMAKNVGMNQHIAKPLDFKQLMEALHKWLG